VFSLSTLLGQLPPPSLAETDFPRFAVRAVGKRPLAEMPRVVEALRQDSLTGYPPTVAPALAVFVERLLAEKVEPATLDVERASELLGSHAGIEALGRAITLERSVLRPGLVVSIDVREFLGERLATLPGFGGPLALLAPVVVTRGHGIGFASVRSPAVARPMHAHEAQAVRDAWGLLEEQTGWPGPLGHLWESRFFRVVARPNHDLDGCRTLLEPMAPPARRALWSAIVEHLRDQDLPEEHRPGDRGLQRRLGLAEIAADAEGLGALVDLAGWLFERLGESDTVAIGHGVPSADDLAVWTSWVQVPEASRQRLGAVPIEEVERTLRALAAREGRRAQPPLDALLAKDVLAFREEYLRLRYRRDVEPLRGVDPLDLVRAQREAGHDVRAIARDVQALADEARRYCDAVRADVARREADELREAEARAAQAARTASEEAAAEADDAARAAVAEELASIATQREAASRATDPDATVIIASTERRAPKEPTPFDGLVPPRVRKPSAPLEVNPFAEAAARREGEAAARPSYDAPPPGFLPPMPVPPARKRPTTRRFELPPLPEPPPRSGQQRPRTVERAGLPASEAAPPTAPARPATPPGATTQRATPEATTARAPEAARPAESAALRSRPPTGDAPLAGRPRPATVESLGLPGERPSSTRPSTHNQPGRALSRPPTVPTLGAAAAAALRAPRDTRLTTPGQATAFYEEAFRELEVFERDLLERGSWPEAERRVRELGKDADALAAALGPPARSGDPTFQSALKKVELVRAYLERIRPLLDGRLPPDDDTPAPAPGMLSRLGRLWGRGGD
jgi:hypothetical protein